MAGGWQGENIIPAYIDTVDMSTRGMQAYVPEVCDRVMLNVVAIKTYPIQAAPDKDFCVDHSDALLTSNKRPLVRKKVGRRNRESQRGLLQRCQVLTMIIMRSSPSENHAPESL